MHVDLSTPESVEQMRRSIVMLAPRAWALRREEADLTVLGIALRQLEDIEAAVRAAPGRARPS